MEKIPADVLDLPVRGVNLMPGTLRDQLGGDTTLLVFLRRFGCGFCREILAELREAQGLEGFPPVLLFFEGEPVEGRALLRRNWGGARAVSDPEKQFYRAFGVERGGLLQVFGPQVWAARRRAVAAGHRNTDHRGDFWRLPGLFLVRGERVLWRREFRHVGDLPDFAGIPAIAADHAEGQARDEGPAFR